MEEISTDITIQNHFDGCNWYKKDSDNTISITIPKVFDGCEWCKKDSNITTFPVEGVGSSLLCINCLRDYICGEIPRDFWKTPPLQG